MECDYYRRRTEGLTPGFKKLLGIAISHEYYCPVHRMVHKLEEKTDAKV